MVMKNVDNKIASLNMLACIFFFQTTVIKPSDPLNTSSYCSALNCWQKTACALHTVRKQKSSLQKLPYAILDKIVQLVGRPAHIMHKLEPGTLSAQAAFYPGYATFEQLKDNQYRLMPFLQSYTKDPENYLDFLIEPGDLRAFPIAKNTRSCYFMYDWAGCTGYLSGKPRPGATDTVSKIMPTNNDFYLWYQAMRAIGLSKKSIGHCVSLKIALPEERSPSLRKIAGFKAARASAQDSDR